MKIALIMPYFGSLPDYFNFYLSSLRNKNLDVLFFSDLKVKEFPANFKQIRMSFDELRTLVEEKLCMRVEISTPRRLCDFRPMYGMIFADYIQEYEYWAFGDCDLVYGRLFNQYLDDAIKSACDLFTLHRTHISGPFCMIRNNSKMNTLWRQADNWREVVAYRGGQCLAFDELHGDWHQQVSSGSMTIDQCRELGDSFSAIALRTPGLRLRMLEYISEKALGHDVVRMRGDGLFRNNQEIACFHYVCSKMRKFFIYVKIPYEEISDYIIDDTGFYPTHLYCLFRPVIALSRKTVAAFRSLMKNGLSRVWK